MKRLSYITAMLAIVCMFACKSTPSDTSEKTQTLSDTKPVIQTQDSSEIAETKIKQILQNYYSEISAGQLKDESVYFADTLATFFNSQNLSRAQAAASVRKGFVGIAEKTVQIDTSSMTIEANPNGYVADFQGTVTASNSKDHTAVNAAFHNRVSFNNAFKISAYEQVNANRSASQGEDALQDFAKQLLAGIKLSSAASLNPLCNPTGIYSMYRPGAIDNIYKFKNFSEMTKQNFGAMGYWKELKTSDVKMEAIPKFDCDKEFSKKGCFVDKVANMNAISRHMKELNKIDGGIQTFKSRDLADTQQLEAQVTHVMIVTQIYTAFYLGQVNGQWYIFAIDQSKYDCSA
jgi:hypothetical protein